MLFRANEEPEITCAGSIHNAEILSSWSAAGEMIETSWRSCEHIKPGDLSTALLLRRTPRREGDLPIDFY